jgi:hypothetical protein
VAAYELEVAEGTYVMLRLEPLAPVPTWMAAVDGFSAVVRTPAELSLMVLADAVPGDFAGAVEGGWRGLFVRGTLEFGLVGVLAELTGKLAEAGVGLLAVSTFDTDWLFVKEADLERARRALG